jgi:hypothetical protein
MEISLILIPGSEKCDLFQDLKVRGSTIPILFNKKTKNNAI